MRNGKIDAMASYNRKTLGEKLALILEGICMDPCIQGKGIFKKLTDCAIKDEGIICLRTQNPRMYRALEKYCNSIYPGERESPVHVKAAIMDFAKYLGCNIDGNGVVKGYYGGLFYGKEPHHERVDPLFKRLGINLHNGDAVIAIGLTSPEYEDYEGGCYHRLNY